MRDKKERVDTTGPAEPLTFSPFSGLSGGGASTPENTVPADETTPGNPAFQVARTKKGGYFLRVERRAGGKSVTVLGGVHGDLHILLNLLKKHCAAGGSAAGETVEVQGEHTETITAFLRGRGY